MRVWWTRVSCLLIAVMLVLSTFTAFAAENQSASNEDAQEDATDDFVILLDCSMSTSQNDTQNLCLQACWDFLDKLPIYDTRVSIFAFGYESEAGSYYDAYTSFQMDSKRDMALIHEIVPLTELTSSADKEEYKLLVQKALEDNRTNRKTWTPYGHALAAAVDMLEKKTDPNDTRNACIILITDGVLSDRQTSNDDEKYVASDESKRLLTEASQKAGSHDWPIYSVQLNYGNWDQYESQLARERLAMISQNGGQNKIGSVECQSDNDVFIALDSIFKDFKNLDQIPPEVVELPGSYYFEVANLTSEASIDIFGEGIASVSLYRVDEDNNRIEAFRTDIHTDIEKNDLMVSAGEGYYAIKLICPEEGRWEAYIEGTGQVEVLVSSNTLQEMRLTMEAQPAYEEDPLTKNNTILVDANFTYHGIVDTENSVYLTMPAVLKVYNINGKAIKTITSQDAEYYHADESGYHFELPLTLFQDEKGIRIQVIVEDGMFRDGIKRSNIKNFPFMDLSTTLVEGLEPMAVTAHVGRTFELDPTDIFVNPDDDILTYELTCADPHVTFAFEMVDGMIQIPAGIVPGAYPMILGIKGESVKYEELTLVVVNDAPWLEEEIPDVELWCDKYSFQEADNSSTKIILNDCFKDFEEMPITYTVKDTPEGVVKWTVTNGVLILEANDGVQGEVLVTVIAADGITDDSYTTAEFTVSVVSGKAVYWKQNWIKYAILAVILLTIVLTVIALIKNRKVKGLWQITVDDAGNVEHIEMDIVAFTAVGKNSKFKLKDLMDELAYSMNDTGWGMVFANYFAVPDAEKIELKGVFRPQGCRVANIPLNNPNIVVNKNGVNATKNKLSFRTGTLTFILTKTDGTGDSLTITMSL